ncbi:MAG TPA: ribonuclease P protein component [Bacteroidales bacterium]|nr:ribonuclease P protein component [Bacteroidales bacterium]
MNIKRQTFKKTERLCSRKIITELFESGKTYSYSHYKILWLQLDPGKIPFPAQVAFSVPKKVFRLAVVRNLIKRRMREAYRKKKHILYNSLSSDNKCIALIFIFRDTSIPTYEEIEKTMDITINKLSSRISEIIN